MSYSSLRDATLATSINTNSDLETSLKPGFGKDVAKTLERASKHFAQLPLFLERNRLTSNAEKIADLRSNLQDALEVQRAVTSLSTILKTSIPTLQKNFSDAFVQEHYTKLPDEVFAIVFEFASLQGSEASKRISHVCRRFRAIALSIPRLWAIIRPTMSCNLEDARTLAERSRCADKKLTVEIDSQCIASYDRNPAQRIDYVLSLLDFVGTLSTRIGHLTLDLAVLNLIQTFPASHRNISLPTLDSFEVILCKNSDRRPVEFEHIYKNWSVPSLHRLHAVNVFPRFPSAVFSQITHFHFETQLDPFPELAEWTLHSLPSFLRKLESIESLKLDLVCDDTHFGEFYEHHFVYLKTLQSLSLKLKGYDSRYASAIFGMFQYETLVSLSIEAGDGILPDLNNLLKSVWTRERFVNLKNLSFVIPPTDHSQHFDHRTSPRTYILKHFLGRRSTVESVYLECAGTDHQVFGFSNRLAAICLKNCNLFSRMYGDGTGPDIVYDMENLFGERGEATDECLVLDGSNASPLKQAEIVRISISDR